MELASAIGYSGTILFFTTSIAIGVAISSGALVSRSIGMNDPGLAREIAINILVFGAIVAVFVSALLWLYIPDLLAILGATSRSLDLSVQYLRIIVPSMVLLTLAMCCSGVLRATGDAKRAMMAIVWGGIVNAILDPIFIFSLEMGVRGAAWASVCARITVLYFAFHGAIRVHNLVGRFSPHLFLRDIETISKMAIPAMLTNIATPIGNAYVIAAISRFGDSAVAGMSIIGRITPVAFGIVFALSGAVGPIIGQNFGAGRMDRIKSTVFDAHRFSLAVIVVMSIILYLLQDAIVAAFGANADAAALVSLFCTWLAATFIFNGSQFISNATLNNWPHNPCCIRNRIRAFRGRRPDYWPEFWRRQDGPD